MIGACSFIVPPTCESRRLFFFIACFTSAKPFLKRNVICTRSGSRMKCGVVLFGNSWKANEIVSSHLDFIRDRFSALACFLPDALREHHAGLRVRTSPSASPDETSLTDTC